MFASLGEILVSKFGTEEAQIRTRSGESRIFADPIDGDPIGKLNFVLRDSEDRIWNTAGAGRESRPTPGAN